MVSYLVPRSRKFFKSTNLEQHSKKKNYDKNTFSRRNSSSSSNSETYNYCSRLFFRRATSVNKSETKTSADPVKGLENKSNQYENIISVLWSWISFSLNILTLGILEWQWHKRKCIAQNVPRRASEFQMMMYCALPLRLMSRCWGWLASRYVPEMLRPYLYGWYSNTFNVNIEEALYPDYKHYRSISEFFTRSLRDGVRPIDATAPVVSPADGRILHYGVVTSDSYIEQVKGVNYKMQDFLGPPLKENNDECENYALALKKHKNDETQLYQCVIYLAPGDYHRFHSATSWIPKLRRHFSGKLLSVNPKVASWMPGLFCLNERVTYIGNWQHGFFSYTAVGATNVGSVQIYIDDKLKTNNWRGLRLQRETRNNNPSYDEVPIENVTAIEKGQLLGQFNMGSTIVLIFEAPKNFVFDVEAGKKILVGQPLGHLQ